MNLYLSNLDFYTLSNALLIAIRHPQTDADARSEYKAMLARLEETFSEVAQ